MLPLGKDNKYFLALNEKRNNFSFMVALSIFLNFYISYISKKS
jgi:uncharacterized membrane protein (DUF485 family)